MSSVNSAPIISIVMPMYRVERYIEKSILSVLNQDFGDWELLVINDGSPDRSREIAGKFALSDNRIKIFDKENGGLSDARNYGLVRSKGEYVHFFDSDDWIEPDFYSKMLSAGNSYDLIVGGYKVDNEKSVTERPCCCGELHTVVDNELYSFVGTYLNFAWNKLFRRSFLVKHSLQYERTLYRIEDSEFMSRFLAYNPNVVLTTCSSYHYMVRNTATLSNIFDNNIFSHLKRSISIHEAIFKQLSSDKEVVRHELGSLSLMAIKSVLRLTLESTPFYYINDVKVFINKLAGCNMIFEYIVCLKSLKLFDKLIIYAISKKRMCIILLISLYYKFKK